MAGPVQRRRCRMDATPLSKHAGPPEHKILRERIRRALQEAGCKPPRQLPDGNFGAECPAHDDQTASLSVFVGDDGQLHVKCHAGCTEAAILQKLNIDVNELRPKVVPITNQKRPATLDYLSSRCLKPYPCIYTDLEGNEVLLVTRRGKKYAQFRGDGEGGWIPKLLPDTPRPLYGVRQVSVGIRAAQTIYVVEGEKCVHAMVERLVNVYATTNPGGAGKWRSQHTAALNGARRVAILPDNDAPGKKHARHVADELVRAGTKDVRVVEIPGLGKGEDVADWLARHPDVEKAGAELAEMVEKADKHQAPPEDTIEGDVRPIVKRGTAWQMENEVVEILTREHPRARIFRQPGAGVIRVVETEAGGTRATVMRAEASQSVASQYVVWSDKRAQIPIARCRSILDWAGYSDKLLELKGVKDDPHVRSDGTVCYAPGYDPTSKMWLSDKAATLPEVDLDPNFFLPPDKRPESRYWVESGGQRFNVPYNVWRVLQPLRKVPYRDPEHIGVALFGMACVVAREWIPGNVQMIISNSNKERSGKGKVLGVMSVITTGRNVIRPAPRDRGEWSKIMVTEQMKGFPLVKIDNWPEKVRLDSAVLAAYTTGDEVVDRILGVSKDTEGTFRQPVWISGNNIQVAKDIRGRTLEMYIDHRKQSPWKLKFDFDPVVETKADRPELLANLLAMIEAFAAMKGIEDFKKAGRTMGGYGEACVKLGSFVRWCGLSDPIGACMANDADDDPEVELLARFNLASKPLFLGKGNARTFGSITDLIKRYDTEVAGKLDPDQDAVNEINKVCGSMDVLVRLKATWIEIPGPGGKPPVQLNAQVIANYVAPNKGTPGGGLCWRSGGRTREKRGLWYLEEIIGDETATDGDSTPSVENPQQTL